MKTRKEGSYSDKAGTEGHPDEMPMPQHTLTPWRQDGNTVRGIDAKGIDFLMAEPERKDDAAFILRAVNNHEELVRALKAVLFELESTTEWQIKNKRISEVMIPQRLHDIERAKQAIAKAEGK
jgi:hypothetical protein